jgi:hypothetical protein
VHGCWHGPFMKALAPRLIATHQLPGELLAEATREPENAAEKDTPDFSVFKAVEAILKGIETPLPAGHCFHDKDGHRRTRVRVRWWDAEAATYRTAAMLAEGARQELPEEPMPEHVRLGYEGEKPLFFGHYWPTGNPQLLSDHVACLNYSIAKGGKLVAYRWDGEPRLKEANFHWVGP